MFMLVISMLEIGSVPILRRFYDIQSLVICATFNAVWTILVTMFSKIMSIFIISVSEIGTAPILRQFYVSSIFGHLCHFWCHLDQFRDKIFKIMSMFIISMFEIGSVPTLRQFYETQIFCHLCHFLCHLDQFGDSIFKNHVHIRNQHVRNNISRFCYRPIKCFVYILSRQPISAFLSEKYDIFAYSSCGGRVLPTFHPATKLYFLKIFRFFARPFLDKF